MSRPHIIVTANTRPIRTQVADQAALTPLLGYAEQLCTIADDGDGKAATYVSNGTLAGGTVGGWTKIADVDLAVAGAFTAAQLDTVAGRQYLGRELFAASLMSGNDIDFLVRVPAGFKLTAIKVATATAPTFSSAAGTFLLTGLRDINGGGNSVLLAASDPFDLETLVAETDTDVPLTAVSADLAFPTVGYILFNVASSVADLAPAGAGDGLLLTVYVEPI